MMKSCIRCGLDESKILEVHHKDRDRTNNELENLEVICPNCHKLEHAGNRKGRPKGLTPPTVSYTLRMPDNLKAFIDEESKKRGMTVAAFVVNACWCYLEEPKESVAEPVTHEETRSAPRIGSVGSNPTKTPPIQIPKMNAAMEKFMRTEISGKGTVSYPGASHMPAVTGMAPHKDYVKPSEAAEPFYGRGMVEMIAEIPACGFKAYNDQDGEHYTCGLEKHSLKQKHGNWRRV